MTWKKHGFIKTEKILILPSCMFKDCEKILNTIEYLHGMYCFKHSQMIQQETYTAKLFRFNYRNNVWEEQRTMILTDKQFLSVKTNADSADYKTKSAFYRYDIMYNNVISQCIYSSNPNMFD